MATSGTTPPDQRSTHPPVFLQTVSQSKRSASTGLIPRATRPGAVLASSRHLPADALTQGSHPFEHAPTAPLRGRAPLGGVHAPGIGLLCHGTPRTFYEAERLRGSRAARTLREFVQPMA
jgi:hypothetical protein